MCACTGLLIIFRVAPFSFVPIPELSGASLSDVKFVCLSSNRPALDVEQIYTINTELTLLSLSACPLIWGMGP